MWFLDLLIKKLTLTVTVPDEANFTRLYLRMLSDISFKSVPVLVTVSINEFMDTICDDIQMLCVQIPYALQSLHFVFCNQLNGRFYPSQKWVFCLFYFVCLKICFYRLIEIHHESCLHQIRKNAILWLNHQVLNFPVTTNCGLACDYAIQFLVRFHQAACWIPGDSWKGMSPVCCME